MNTSSAIDSLVRLLRSGNRTALARALSLIEDGGELGAQVGTALYPFTGNAYVIGITGAPGAGKSTLVDQLAVNLSKEGKRVAVLAVDPSSPFTGGALLGDRIRMSTACEKHDVFIRSMASRGVLGGLAPYTSEAIFALDAAGFDYVLVETVGVGQGEVEIVRTTDTVIVVLVPGMGDSIQALKAGILEIADIFAINKADYEGVHRLEKELLALLSLQPARPWKPPVKKTVATEGSGVTELLQAVQEHREWGATSGEYGLRRRTFLKETLLREMLSEIQREVRQFVVAEGRLEGALKELETRTKSPIVLAQALLRDFQQRGAVKGR